MTRRFEEQAWKQFDAPLDELLSEHVVANSHFIDVVRRKYEHCNACQRRHRTENQELESDEYRLAASTMVRQLIVAPPHELQTVLDGCELLKRVLLWESVDPPDRHPGSHRRYQRRTAAIVELKAEIERLCHESPQANDLKVVQSWLRGLDDCSDATARQVLEAIDAWDRDDRELLAATVEELAAQ